MARLNLKLALGLSLAMLLAACGGGAAPAPAASSPGTASVAPALTSAAPKPAGSAAASASASASVGTIKAAFGVISVASSPLWAAVDEGLFKNEGLNVELSSLESAALIQAIVSGSISIGTGSTVNTVNGVPRARTSGRSRPSDSRPR